MAGNFDEPHLTIDDVGFSAQKREIVQKTLNRGKGVIVVSGVIGTGTAVVLALARTLGAAGKSVVIIDAERQVKSGTVGSSVSVVGSYDELNARERLNTRFYVLLDSVLGLGREMSEEILNLFASRFVILEAHGKSLRDVFRSFKENHPDYDGKAYASQIIDNTVLGIECKRLVPINGKSLSNGGLHVRVVQPR